MTAAKDLLFSQSRPVHAVFHCVASTGGITQRAIELATQYDLGPMDAIHGGAALAGKGAERLTVETPTTPLLRARVADSTRHGGKQQGRCQGALRVQPQE